MKFWTSKIVAIALAASFLLVVGLLPARMALADEHSGGPPALAGDLGGETRSEGEAGKTVRPCASVSLCWSLAPGIAGPAARVGQHAPARPPRAFRARAKCERAPPYHPPRMSA